MAQLVVRNLEESVKARIQRRAKRNGRSMEDEVRCILRVASIEKPQPRKLGTEIVELFSGRGLSLEIPERSRELPRPADFGQ